jgi:hypothetical protein
MKHIYACSQRNFTMQDEDMQRRDFHVGMEFYTASGRWRCTDVGRRTVVAIHINAGDASWYSRPPYAVAESIIDEDAYAGCEPTYARAYEAYGESFAQACLAQDLPEAFRAWKCRSDPTWLENPARDTADPGAGMRHRDFRIGREFFNPSGIWRCTDVGRRTIMAINVSAGEEYDYIGPSYFVAEHVFDEDARRFCEPTYEKACAAYGEHFMRACRKGSRSAALRFTWA